MNGPTTFLGVSGSKLGATKAPSELAAAAAINAMDITDKSS
jgi:hypothetical protein